MSFKKYLKIDCPVYNKFFQDNDIVDVYTLFGYINRRLINPRFNPGPQYLNENYVHVGHLYNFQKNTCENQVFYYWKTAIKNGILRKFTIEDYEMLEIIKKKSITTLSRKREQISELHVPNKLQDQVTTLSRKREQISELYVPNKLQGNNQSSIPPEFIMCPITQKIMIDPILIVSGITYERKAIEIWFEDHNTCPLTEIVLLNKRLIPNIQLRSIISNYKSSYC